jgi:NTP pyrophosphatase (non-canonical NTP hydrolase)
VGGEALVILDSGYVRFLLDFVKHVPRSDEFRMLKLAEEVGEASQALIIHRKLDPRKLDLDVRSHDVAMELGDVAMTALVAIASLGFNPSDILAEQWTKTLERFDL